MPANTTSVKDILMKIAEDCGQTRSAFVHTVNSQTSLKLSGISLGPHETFLYALTTTNGGGIRKVTAHAIATEVITLDTAFDVTVAAGDTVKLAWWEPNARDQAMAAIRESIRQSWGTYGRETIAATSIELSAGDAVYDLPATIGELWRVGILETSGEYDWRAERDLWRLGGEAGAYTIQFLYNGTVFLPSKWSGKTLYAWYLDAEPQVDLESDTTRLPLDYFNLASYLYLAKQGMPPVPEGADARLLRDNFQAKLSQLKLDADAARRRLKRGRPQRPVNARYERRM